MDEKVNIILGFLPECKEIFLDYAQFEDARDVPKEMKGKYFDKNLKSTAQQFVSSSYKDKKLDDIDEIDFITDFQEWLQGGKVFTRLSLNRDEPTKNLVKQKPEEPSPKVVQKHAVENTNEQKPKHAPQQVHFPQPQNYRSNPIVNQQYQQVGVGSREDMRDQKMPIKRTPRTIMLENLSHCLQFPEKRFLIMPQMAPKFNEK